MLKKIAKARIIIMAAIFACAVLYAAEPLGTACKGCGTIEMCTTGGNYYGTGYQDCIYDPEAKPPCQPSGMGWCSGGV